MSRDDDLLERATRALRATPPPDEGELARAKLRMLAAHQAATKKGGRTLRWVLPLAAVLAAGSALAATPHGYEKLAEAVNRVVGFEILAAAPKADAKLARKPASKSGVSSSEPSVAEPAPSEPAASEPSVAEPAPSDPAVAEPSVAEPQPSEPAIAQPVPADPANPASRGAAVGGTAPGQSGASASARRTPRAASSEPKPPEQVVAPEPPPAPEPAEEPAPIASVDLAKYRAAHKAHFQQRDFALALRGWEQYLRQFPNGTFAIEARYNRAICLLRLGRNDEARRALTPFSKGEIGAGYRQAEATKLLEALE